MADSTQDNPSRSPADKERSRQQSRPIGGREATRPTGGGRGPRPPKGGPGGPSLGGRGNGKGRGGPGPGRKGPGASRGGAGSGRPPRPRPGGARPGRSTTALLTWGVVALVIVIVVVLVVVKLTGSSPTSTSAVKAGPVPATIVQQVTHVPASVFDTVGVSSGGVTVTPPKLESNQTPLVISGKPGLFYEGGEYCPFCAAERWSLIASLSRFGTFSGLETMQSSGTDQFPNTQTFSFVHTKYTSPYLSTSLVEYFSNVKDSAGGYTLLQPVTKHERALQKRYDPGTNPTSSGSIPFIDIGNKAIITGASYSPSILQNLSRATIASGLSDPSNPVTRAIIATSNYISASICAVDGGQPAAVCTSKGVVAATKALGLGP
ncbi:MAG: DUF929 family protein [Acidimicrobiales bacterium]